MQLNIYRSPIPFYLLPASPLSSLLKTHPDPDPLLCSLPLFSPSRSPCPHRSPAPAVASAIAQRYHRRHTRPSDPTCSTGDRNKPPTPHPCSVSARLLLLPAALTRPASPPAGHRCTSRHRGRRSHRPPAPLPHFSPLLIVEELILGKVKNPNP
uniref:Uncharacterized protein n=1 Tax=Opuntia streptacantha TaxID=393608 RepID=A0A7C8Z5R3_OPUST